MKNEVKGIPVLSPALARILLKLNYSIIDIKPNRQDRNKIVFIFESNDEIPPIVDGYVNKIKNKK